MRFEVKIQSGRESSEHVLELPVTPGNPGEAGNNRFLLDGGVVCADWALIAPGVYSVLLQGRPYQARIWKAATPAHGNRAYQVSLGMPVFQVELQDPRSSRRRSLSAAHNGPEDVVSPMPGRIVKVLALEGARVAPGQGLLVIEAMKMQNEVRASRAGQVEKIHVREGDGVEAGSPLLRLA
jgi:biotin carboxyl carrier protein